MNAPSLLLREVIALRESLRERQPVLDAIVSTTALACGVEVAAMRGKDRSKSIVEARLVACYVARRCTRASYPQIGRVVNRDHTTVISAVQRVAMLIERDPWIRALAAALCEEFGEKEEAHAQ